MLSSGGKFLTELFGTFAASADLVDPIVEETLYGTVEDFEFPITQRRLTEL